VAGLVKTHDLNFDFIQGILKFLICASDELIELPFSVIEML